jgi:hypothetical protein
MGKGVRILPISISNTSGDLQHAVKYYDMGPPALLPVRSKVCCGLLSPFKIHRLGGAVVTVLATGYKGRGFKPGSYSFTTSALDGGVSGQSHAPAALYPRRKDPRYPLYRRLGWPQSRSGQRRWMKNPFASVGDRTTLSRSSSP